MPTRVLLLPALFVLALSAKAQPQLSRSIFSPRDPNSGMPTGQYPVQPSGSANAYRVPVTDRTNVIVRATPIRSSRAYPLTGRRDR
ncbi:MAG: hypothetical protein IPG69_16430 [Flavobacteriales bacterium]|nr:hypothetical protein [Flavobacteriales bacterium]MBK7268043.1 hypothetical protein [Flavobacteriales bacterium]MBK9539346.1 hypothetical protein [Flavobacteriales bacterium]